LASPIQIEITRVLKLFGFEDSGERLPPGGGAELVVTEKTVETIQGFLGAIVTVPDSGDIEIRMT
jgi:hypothetical protein